MADEADVVDVAAVVARRVAQLRVLRGWSQSDLAGRLRDFGFVQTTVARLEGGKRKVSVEELVALADALETSPIYLLTPDDAGEQVRLSTGDVSASDLRSWMRAFDPLPHQDPKSFLSAMPFDDRVFLADNDVAFVIEVARQEARAMADGDREGLQEARIMRSAIAEQARLRDEQGPPA